MTVPLLDELFRQSHIADIDRHFGALAAEIDGRARPEVAVAAALASHSARSGHACLSLSEVAGRAWPEPAGEPLPAFEPWIEALAASPAVARAGAEERRPPRPRPAGPAVPRALLDRGA